MRLSADGRSVLALIELKRKEGKGRQMKLLVAVLVTSLQYLVFAEYITSSSVDKC